MSKFANSFDTIYEALITRATTGCFSAGDVVTFDMKKLQKHNDYKSLTASLKTRLDDMMRTSDNGEAVIVVTDTTLGTLNGTKSPQPSTITIAYSHGGGRWVEPITIPGSLTEFMNAIEPGVNVVDKIPSVVKVEYPVSTEAEEVDLKELEKNRTKGHASSTLHGESYSNRFVQRRSSYSDYSPSASRDLEMEVDVYLGIEDVIKGWINNPNYEKPQMDVNQLYNQTLQQLSDIDGFGEDREGKKCFFWKNFSTNTSDAKWYAEENQIDEDLAENILFPLRGAVNDSFDEYLLDKLDDYVEIYGAEDWEDIVREHDDDWDDYQDTIASSWYNR